MKDLAKVAYDAWRNAGGLETILFAPEYEDLSATARDQWNSVAQALDLEIDPPNEDPE